MQTLLALIPILVFASLWAILYEAGIGWRPSFLAASVLWAVFLVAVTELLSLLHGITFAAVLALWAAALLLVLSLAARRIAKPNALWRQLTIPQLSPFEWAVLGGCAGIAAVTAVIAYLAPPNTYDSLTYHMPRVMHWIQNQSVAYYPTAIIRQLYIAPGAEFVILHLQLLTGSDRLANFVQWFGMAGSAIGVSLIADRLGVDRRGQLIAAAASMSIPMGILQSTRTQTDYATAFWLVCFVCWMLSLVQTGRLWNSAAAGASLGLAALTKSTAYIFALPFLVWFGIWLLVRYRAHSAAFWAAIAVIFLAINAGVYARNMQLFGNPLGIVSSIPTERYSNDVFSGPELASNIVRNLSLHMGTPFASANRQIQQWIVALHQRLGISVEDRRTTWPGTRYQVIYRTGENGAGNPLQLVLIVLSIAFILARAARKGLWLAYIGSVLLAFAAFCLYLKWQPWNSRLQLPLFILFAPVLAKALGDIHPRRIGGGLALALLLSALPWLFFNEARPVFGQHSILNADRTGLYFQNVEPDVSKSYSQAVEFFVRQSGGDCSRVAVDLGTNDAEYLLWVLLGQETRGRVLIESVQVENVSRRFSESFSSFPPCAVFVRNPAPAGNLDVGGTSYSNSYTAQSLSVFLPKQVPDDPTRTPP